MKKTAEKIKFRLPCCAEKGIIMKNSGKKMLFVFCITTIIALLTGVFRTYLLINYIEPDTGFYIVGTNVNIYFNILCIVLAAFIVIAAFAFRKKEMPKELSSESTLVVFAASLCGFLFATVIVFGIYKFATGASRSVFLAIELLLCIPCAVNFLNVCLKEVRKKSVGQTLLALSPAVYFAVKTIEVFVDTKTQINTSQRSLMLVMLCSMMLFFVTEAVFMLPGGRRQEGKYPNTLSKYYAFGIFSFDFALVALVPYIIVSAFWMYNSSFIVMDVLHACVGLYAATRMFVLVQEK